MKQLLFLSLLISVAMLGCKRSVDETELTSIQAPPSSLLKTAPPKAALKTKRVERLLLNARSTLTFRGVVTSEKIATMQLELIEMSRKLNVGETIYLVLDTPGGEIDAGKQFIDTTKSIPQEVKTITVFAASMGFQFVQNMGERLIVPSGTLMSHRARFGGLSGQVPGEYITRLNYGYRGVLKLDVNAAERMGLSLEKYQALVHDEYWVDGQDAVEDHAADRMVLARCDESFNGTSEELLGEMFGVKIYGVMSKCPIYTGILALKMHGGESDPVARSKAEAAFRGYLNRRSFVEKYILEQGI
jgi:ATP-dependent protease ClpP protease subunit